jgi:hypothetical protein
MLLRTTGAKAALFFLCCIAWILMGMPVHFLSLYQSKPWTGYCLAIATCAICILCRAGLHG